MIRHRHRQNGARTEPRHTLTTGSVVVVCGYPPTDGVGGGIILLRLLEHLPAEAISVVSNARVSRDIEAGGARLLSGRSVGIAPWRPTVPGLRRLSRILNLACILKTAAAIARLPTDGAILAVPWGGELGSELFVGAYLAHRRTGARLVIYEMDEWSSSLGEKGGVSARLLERLVHATALRSASTVWTVSASLAHQLNERYGVHPKVLPGPVDLACFRNIDPPASIAYPVRILFTGAVYGAQADAISNVAKAVKSMDGDAELIIYTATDEQDLCRVGIAGKFVTVQNPVPNLEFPQLLATADLLLLPFSFEPEQRGVVTTSFPTKVGEYLASRRPVLVHAPAYSSIVTAAREEGWGLVVDQPDIGLIEEAIRLIVTDHSAAIKLTNRARVIAEERYALERCRDAFCSSLRKGGEEAG